MKNIYKLEYIWYEGDEGSCYIISDLEQEDFEKLLKKGITEINKIPEAQSFLFVKYDEFCVKCVPEAYEKLQTYLERNGCEIGYLNHETYGLDDGFVIIRINKKIIRDEL